MPSRVYRFNENRKLKKPFAAVTAQIREAKKNGGMSRDVIVELAKIGREAIDHARAMKDAATRLKLSGSPGNGYPGNDLYNQDVAYAYAVYFNGVEKAVGYYDSKDVFFGEEWGFGIGLGITKADTDPDRKRGVRGFDAARKAIQNFHPTTKGYCLVILNAMWYSTIHERTGLNVISREISEAYGKVQVILSRTKTTASIRTVNTATNR